MGQSHVRLYHLSSFSAGNFELKQLVLKGGVLFVSEARSDEGLTLETSALESVYGGQFTFSYQLC